MPYCPKCGNKVDETTAFCPNCGTSLKGASAPEPGPPEQSNWNQQPEKPMTYIGQEPEPEKKEKEHGFIGYLMAGLILVTFGAFALMDLTNPATASQDLSAMLLIIGIIIIVGAIYIAITTRKQIQKSVQTNS